MKRALFWFKYDLRLTDNSGLIDAINENDEVLLVYILDNDPKNPWRPGYASLWYLCQSLKSLADDIIQCGGQLLVLQGKSLNTLTNIAKQYNIQNVYWNRCYEPYLIARDTHIKKELQNNGLTVKSFNSSLLIEPQYIKNKAGDFFKVYTPFKNKVLPLLETIKPEKQIRKITTLSLKNSDSFESWPIWPTGAWTQQLAKHHSPSEKHAKKTLKNFINDKIEFYSDERDFPANEGVSKLSPYLHWGQLGPRQVLHAVLEKLAISGAKKSIQTYLSQLIWREFCYYLLFHFPSLPKSNFKAKFNTFQWQDSPSNLACWQKGQTGYPIVDAGMRELWDTGIMHNRVRMIVASFLTKDLLLHWHHGQAWFWDTLVDADLANNAAGWQWVAGSGADAQPYFRIFNPVSQSSKFDPDGEYLRHWLPELANLPTPMMHAPWEHSATKLQKYGVVLGKTYPLPLIDHKAARTEALRLYKLL